MTVQSPGTERRGKKSEATVAAKVEEIVGAGAGFDVKRFVENFEVLAEADGGVSRLRGLVMELALTKGFEGNSEIAWKAGTLGDFVSFLNGYAFKSEWFSADGVRLLRNANVSHGTLDWTDRVSLRDDRTDEFERFSLSEGDIVLSLDRPIISSGIKVARVTSRDLPCLLLQRVAKLSGRDDIIAPAFLFLWLRSPLFTRTIDPGRSNGVPHISTKQVASLPLVLPPLAEQKRIVAKVDQLMALCDELEARQTKKRETGARLTKSALDALTTAEGPDEFDAAWKRVVENFDVLIDRAASFRTLREALQAVLLSGRASHGLDFQGPQFAQALLVAHRAAWEQAFPSQKYRAPELGNVPEDVEQGWVSATLELLCPIIVDSPHRTPRYGPGRFLALRPRDVTGGVLNTAQAATVDDAEYLRQTERRSPQAGDIVYSRELSYGWAVILPAQPVVCLSQGMVSMRPSALVEPEYVCALLNSPLGRRQAHGAALGGAHAHVNLKEIRQFTFPVPPLKTQRLILERVRHFMKACDELEARFHGSERLAAKLIEAIIQELLA